MALPCCGQPGQQVRVAVPKDATVGPGDIHNVEYDCACGVHWIVELHVLAIEDMQAMVYVSGVTGIRGTSSYLKVGRLAHLHFEDGIMRERGRR